MNIVIIPFVLLSLRILGMSEQPYTLYHQLDPRIRPNKTVFVCRKCGLRYWNKKAICRGCGTRRWKKRAWPWPAFTVIDQNHVQCRCGYTWKVRKRIKKTSHCPSCRSRLLVANRPPQKNLNQIRNPLDDIDKSRTVREPKWNDDNIGWDAFDEW